MAAFGAARCGHMGEKQQSKSPIRLEGYTTTEGEIKMTNFAELVEICDQFFPPLALTQRRTAVEDSTKDAV